MFEVDQITARDVLFAFMVNLVLPFRKGRGGEGSGGRGTKACGHCWALALDRLGE